MKLLVLPEWYYPEVASTAQLFGDILSVLKTKYDITVICKVPCYTGKVNSHYKENKIYTEEQNGIHVVMIPMKDFQKSSKINRLKSLISYYKKAKKQIREFGKSDIVFSLASPPLFGGLLAEYAKKHCHAKLVYEIQDFSPESMRALGYIKFRSILDFAQKVDNHVCRSSSLVVVVGRDMQETLRKRLKNKRIPKNVVINNWIDDRIVVPLPKSDPLVQKFLVNNNINNTFNIMYSGNIGLFYDLPNIVKILTEFKDPTVRFVFVGDGAEKKHIEDIVKESNSKNFVFLPYQAKEDLAFSLNSADVHLVLSAKGFKGVSVPSKIYGILAVNKPIIGVMEKGSEGATVLEESNSGILIEPRDYENLRKTISFVLANRDEFSKKYCSGRKYLDANLSRDKSLSKYIQAFKLIGE